MHTIREKRETLVKGEFDAIVLGGGIAGVSAAVSMGRKGKKVMLIEKSVFLGGLATNGLIYIYLALCDGFGHQLIGGIAKELFHLSIKNGYNNFDVDWAKNGKRYETIFSPPEFIINLDQWLLEANVTLKLDTLFCDVIKDNKKIKGIIVENKSGRSAYLADYFIDATGDSDLFYRAGASCVSKDNYLSYWAFSTSLDDMKKAVLAKNVQKGILMHNYGLGADGHDFLPGMKKYYGTNDDEVTSFICEGRKLVAESFETNKKKGYNIITLPSMPQYRTTRRIEGICTMQEPDQNTYVKRSVGCIGDWRNKNRGIYYEIPFEALLSNDVENAVAVGRMISAKGEAWEATRVIPVAAMTGEIAGVACSLALDMNIELNNLPIDLLQDELKKNGLLIHYEW